MTLDELGLSTVIYSIKDCVMGHPIGSGASMQVFEGTCTINGTTTKVAFKRPHKFLNESMRKKSSIRLTSMIKRELTVMERLKSNANVVDLYGLTIDGMIPVLIVELAKCSLDHYLSNALQRNRPITWIEKLRLCRDICDGLLALHAIKIV